MQKRDHSFHRTACKNFTRNTIQLHSGKCLSYLFTLGEFVNDYGNLLSLLP